MDPELSSDRSKGLPCFVELDRLADISLADAAKRGVRYDKASTRRSGDRHVVRTIASPYLAELGPAAPRPQRGQDWLRSR